MLRKKFNIYFILKVDIVPLQVPVGLSRQGVGRRFHQARLAPFFT